jgi:hypothetical protein
MATQSKIPETLKSVVGGTLVGFGLHILYGNLDRAAAQLRHLLGTPTGETLGGVPSVILAAAQAAHVYAFDHQGFLLALLRLLVSLWPLIPVIVGVVLLQDVLTDRVKGLPTPTKYFQNKNSGCRFCCPSFDA